jgi:hypothetical protein
MWDRWRAKWRAQSYFLWRQGDCSLRIVLADQTVNSTYYCDFFGDCLKVCEDFGPSFGDKWPDCCITTLYYFISFFTRELLIKNDTTVVPHPPYFSLFPWLKIKLKGHYFDTTEVIGTELQVVLNMLTEQDFRDAFNNGRSTGNSTYAQETTLRVMVASRPKVSFWPDGNTSPWNYEWIFVFLKLRQHVPLKCFNVYQTVRALKLCNYSFKLIFMR